MAFKKERPLSCVTDLDCGSYLVVYLMKDPNGSSTALLRVQPILACLVSQGDNQAFVGVLLWFVSIFEFFSTQTVLKVLKAAITAMV